MSKKITLEGLDHFKDKENAMIAGKPESTNTATVAHAVGEYFYWKGVLYIVTAAIAVGGTIQTNTNVKPAVLADDVGALKKSISNIETEVSASFEQKTITDVPIASFDDGADNIPVKKLVLNIEPMQRGLKDPSFSNVREIVPISEAYIAADSFNLWDEEWENGYFTTDGRIVDSNIRIRTKNYIPVKPGANYYIKTPVAVEVYASVYFYYENHTFIQRRVAYNATITAPDAARYMTFDMSAEYGNTYNHDICISFSSDKNGSYEKHKPENIVSFPFPIEAGSIYYGSIEINDDGTGKIISSETIVNLKSLLWTMNISGQFFATLQRPCVMPRNNKYFKSNVYIASNNGGYTPATDKNITITGGMTARVWVVDFDYTTTNEFINALPENAILIYKSDNNIEYELSAEQIKTLLGYNNLWSNTGDIQILIYRTKENIKTLIAPVLDSMVADTTLAINDFRIVGDTLYKVTAPIASGGTLTVGTNVTATTIGEQITALLE